MQALIVTRKGRGCTKKRRNNFFYCLYYGLPKGYSIKELTTRMRVKAEHRFSRGNRN
jgi:hypothetical protein